MNSNIFPRDFNAFYRNWKNALTNVKSEKNLPSDNPTEVVALNQAVREYRDIVSKCHAPWFVRYFTTANLPEHLVGAVKLMPLTMHALNQSKRLRRIGVSGARLVNTYPRAHSYAFIANCVFTTWEGCAAFAWKFLFFAGLEKRRIVVTLPRVKGRRVRDEERVGEFIRKFYSKSTYWGKNVALDPIGELDIVVTRKNGKPMNYDTLVLIMDWFGDDISHISFGTGYDADLVISRRELFDEENFEATQRHRDRPCKYRYLTRFGECIE